MSILGLNSRNYRLRVNVVENFDYRWKLSKMSIIGENWRKCPFWFKTVENFWLWVNIVENVDYGSKLSKMLISGQDNRKYWFWVKIVKKVYGVSAKTRTTKNAHYQKRAWLKTRTTKNAHFQKRAWPKKRTIKNAHCVKRAIPKYGKSSSTQTTSLSIVAVGSMDLSRVSYQV